MTLPSTLSLERLSHAAPCSPSAELPGPGNIADAWKTRSAKAAVERAINTSTNELAIIFFILYFPFFVIIDSSPLV